MSFALREFFALLSGRNDSKAITATFASVRGGGHGEVGGTRTHRARTVMCNCVCRSVVICVYVVLA